MNRDFHLQAEQLNKKHRRKRVWYRILSVPICLVVFVTTYALILPAITMESTPDTYCGLQEHVHGDDCYEIPGTPGHKEIRCTPGAALGEGEYLIHQHDSFCFDDKGELLCALPEQAEHTHTEECYEDGNLVCSLVTGVIHQHTAECIVSVPATEPQGLQCTIEEHRHTEECFVNPEDAAQNGQPGSETPGEGTPAEGEPANGEPANDEPAEGEPANETPGEPGQTGDVPEGADPDGNPANAPAANEADPNGAPLKVQASGRISDVTIQISDNVSSTGCYEAAVTDSTALEGKNVRFLWFRSTDGGATYTAVKQQSFTAGGKIVSNVSGDNNENLFLALDGGTVSDSLESVKYKVTLQVDGTEYTNVSATITNTTYQASVLNGSFEAPDLTNHQYQEFVPEGTAGLYWKTTAANTEAGQHVYGSASGTGQNDGKHYIEIVDTGTTEHKNYASNYHQQGSASNGSQYAEINAGAAGALYQTIATIPGTTMYWSVDHCGRDGTDTMAVVMMPESRAKGVTTQSQLQTVLENPGNYGATVVTNLNADQAVWTTHSGQYVIPEGQYETRFFFMAVKTANDNPYVGNHIDNVWFSQQIPPASTEKPYFMLTKRVEGSLSEEELQLLSGQLTFTVEQSYNDQFTSPQTVKSYTARALGDWTQNDDGSWTLNARISMRDQETGDYYRIVESGAELDGYTLTATDNNNPVRLQSSTDTEFTFVNSYVDSGRTLTLTKTVSAADTAGDFTFTISYADAKGTLQTQTLTLQHNGSGQITGIPRGASVTVTETSADGYTVIMKDGTTGEVLAGGSSYTFTMSDDAAIEVHNTSTVALPETGGMGRMVFSIAGIALMLSAVITGCLLRRRFGKEGD